MPKKTITVLKDATLSPGWPADSVERRKVADLLPYARNSRVHSDEQVAQLARSIEEWGWTMPVLVDEGGVLIAGHGRIMAAMRLGIEEVPTMTARGWSPEKRAAYVIADNKLAENASWDDDTLRLELASIRESGFDLTVTGFDAEALDVLFAVGTEGQTDPNAAPPAPAVPITQVGELWILGSHRLMCGSSTDANDVEDLLDGAKPHLMVTDPPYGVGYDPTWRDQVGKDAKGVTQPISSGKVVKHNAAVAAGKVMNDDESDWRLAWSLFPGKIAYVWHAGLHSGRVMNSLLDEGFEIRAQIIWAKHQMRISRGHYHWKHEPAWFAARDGAVEGEIRQILRPLIGEAIDDSVLSQIVEAVEKVKSAFDEEHEAATYSVRQGETSDWSGDRKQTTLWMIEQIRIDTGHGAQKPVECMKRPIENNSIPGQSVYEPFSGSGTTIIAAEMTGRRCFAMELNPAYVDVAVRRWQEFTGREAVLSGDGRTFEEVADQRREAWEGMDLNGG